MKNKEATLKEQVKKIICGGGNPKNTKSINWTEKGLDFAYSEILKLIYKEIKKNRPKETDVKCLWCGRNYFEHDIPPYGEAVAKTPCLGRREGFYPDNKRTLSEYNKIIADTLGEEK